MHTHTTAISPFEALRIAVMRAGGQQQLADFLKVSRVTVSNWDKLPAEKVLGVEEEFGVSRHWLRPDIYPTELPSGGDRFCGVDLRTTRVSFQTPSVLKGRAA